jgi:SAM-dependent methyltransferase
MRLKSRPYRPWYVIGENGGEVALERQFSGLHMIDVSGKTVLELGCAEGLVSLEMIKRGARLVHGVELRDRALEVARSIAHVTSNNDRMTFWLGNLTQIPDVLSQPGMLDSYDVVTAMAVLQKMPNQPSILEHMLQKCRETFVIRLPVRKAFQYRYKKTAWSFNGADVVPLIEAQGFKMRWEGPGYPKGEPPFSMDGEAWMAAFDRVKL